jgi:putative ABC transport system permease protein
MTRLLRRAWTRLIGTFSGRRADRELSEELESHIRLMAEDLIRGGAAPNDARRRARLTFGSVESTTENYRERRGFPLFDALRDLKYATRSLLRDRGSVAMALLALSLGIGATTVIFSVVHSVLIDAFPFRDQSKVVHFIVQRTHEGETSATVNFTPQHFLAYRDRNRVFSHVLGAANITVLYEVDDTTHFVEGALIDTQMLSALGLPPILGRDATEADGVADAAPTFLMSDRLWNSGFRRDPSVLGRTFKMNGVARTLIGIAPPRFLLFGADVFFPTTIRTNLTAPLLGGTGTRPVNGVFTFARLKAGVTPAQAAADVERIARELDQDAPASAARAGQLKVTVRAMSGMYTAQRLKDMVWILMGAVAMLLLIACSNVANLLLARATARETEMAVRASLGASRWRLVRQLLSESLVLATAGTAIGGLLAYVGLQWVRATIPRSALPSEMAIRFSVEALSATIGVTLLTALVCGAAPALRAARGSLQQRLVGNGKGAGLRTGSAKMRAVLVTVQVTLAIVLLVGSGLMMRSLFQLQRVDLGLSPKNVLMGRFVFPVNQSQTLAERSIFVQRLLEKVAALPGVVSASPATAIPVAGTGAGSSNVTVPGATIPQRPVALEFIGEGYFHTLGMSLVRGRLLTKDDVDHARKVAVVNRQFAQVFLGGGDPTGRVATFASVDRRADPDSPQLFEIVGVVADARNAGLEGDIRPQAYLPYSVPGAQITGMLIKTNVEPGLVQQTVKQQIWAVDRRVAMTGGPLELTLQRNYLDSPRFGLVLMTTFAAVGLILSTIGVFSVTAYTVSLQKHEIGIRMALGAQPENVMRAVVLKGLRPILAGLVIGVATSYWLTRVMANQITGISTTDPLTFAGVALVLAVVGTTACVLPARRAMRVDPLTALRAQ